MITLPNIYSKIRGRGEIKSLPPTILLSDDMLFWNPPIFRMPCLPSILVFSHFYSACLKQLISPLVNIKQNMRQSKYIPSSSNDETNKQKKTPNLYIPRLVAQINYYSMSSLTEGSFSTSPSVNNVIGDKKKKKLNIVCFCQTKLDDLQLLQIEQHN